MEKEDHLVYFNFRSRAGPARMLYAIAGKSFNDEQIPWANWLSRKAEQPLGQLPVLHTQEGTLCQTGVIARYIAKKLGLVGTTHWDEAQNDLVVECCMEVINNVIQNIYMWLLFGEPKPENPEAVLEEWKNFFIKRLNYIQKVAENRGKKYLLSDEMQLADIFLYSTLEFSRVAFPDSMELTPWIKGYVQKIESCEKVKKYLAERSTSATGH